MNNHLNTTEFIEQIELYLDEKLSLEQKKSFELYLHENKEAFQTFVEYKKIFQLLQLQKNTNKLILTLSQTNKKSSINFFIKKEQLKLRYLIYKNKSIIVAASIISCFFILGFYLLSVVFNHSNQLVELKRNFSSTIKKLETKINTVDAPKNSDIDNVGTGFLIDNDGFILTNSHILNDSKNIYVENIQGDYFKTQIVHVDKDIDIAILKIIDTKFKSKDNVPFKLSPRKVELGENIFTLGFPKDDIVYSEGYLSSLTGYNSDSLTLQMSISLNPGNSGGPIFDNQGNIIGVVRNKQKEADGVSFAIKSSYILQTIQNAKYNDIEKQLKGLQITKNIPLPAYHGNKTSIIKKYQKYIYLVKSYS